MSWDMSKQPAYGRLFSWRRRLDSHQQPRRLCVVLGVSYVALYRRTLRAGYLTRTGTHCTAGA